MSMRVLSVDDEYLITTSLQAFLEDEGFVAASATSGEQAIEILKEDMKDDVCIMDMRLTGMDGNSAMLSIHEMCPEIRFIVHTGSVNYIMPGDLKRSGICVHHLFKKPLIDMSLVADAIRSFQII
ncbi:MAG: response regulator [Gammaproteobacteria bacterium]